MDRILLWLLTVIVLLGSCKTEQKSISKTDFQRIEKGTDYENTLVYIVDTILIDRTDTLVVQKQSRDRLVEHTVWKTDTVTVEVQTVVEKQTVSCQKVTPRWCRWLLIADIIIVVVVIIVFLLRLYFRKRP